MAKRHNYTAEELAFLEAGYKRMAIRDLTPAFNARFGTARDEGRIKAVLQNHRMKCGRGYGQHLMPESNIFTPAQTAWLRAHWPLYGPMYLTCLCNAAFGTHFRRTQVEGFLANHHIVSNRTGCWEKGHGAWNKGTKGLTRANRGTFKKGNICWKTRPVGSERYSPKWGWLVKVAEPLRCRTANIYWGSKAVMIWEAAHGPLPKGFAVALRDGDNRNCVEENLMLVSRAELLTLNGHRYKDAPGEIKPAILALAKLEVKAHCRTYRLNYGRKRRAQRG